MIKAIAVALFLALAVQTLSFCPKDWLEFNGHCYRKFPQVANIYDSAVEFCQSMRGQMLTIDSEAEASFVAKTFAHLEGNIWVDAARSRYKNWYSALEGFFGAAMNCAMIRWIGRDQAAWFKVECDRPEEVVCKAAPPSLADYMIDVLDVLNVDVCHRPTVAPPTDPGPTPGPTRDPSPTAPSGCPVDWHHFENRCYLLAETPMNQTEAIKFCGRNAALLASIHGADENAFVGGLSPTDGIWLGAVSGDQVYPKFLWIDGTGWNYARWAAGHPDGTGDRCIMIRESEWSNWPCGTSLLPLCSKEIY